MLQAPKDFVLGIEMEIEGIHDLTVVDVPTKLKKEGIILDEVIKKFFFLFSY